jgi:integrase
VTFADACAEYLRYVEHDLDRKPSTVGDYRSAIRAHLVPAFGSFRLEDVTADRIEAWKATLRVGNRTKIKLLTVLNGVLARARRVHRLRHNPMADVEKPRHRVSAAIEVFSPEEVWALVRAADSQQDGALYLTAAFTGLRRGELVALRWRDVDFAAHRIRVCGSYAGGRLTTPKSGKVRSVPLAPDVATALARLASAAARPATTTWSSRASPAAISMPQRCPSVTRPRSRAHLCGRSAFTNMPTPSGRA